MSVSLLDSSPHNQRAASMPMMVGMMVCAVMVCALEAHNVIRQLRELSLYPTVSPGVNEFTKDRDPRDKFVHLFF